MKDIVSHILALETALEDVFLLETETELYIIHNLCSSRGGQSQDRSIGHIGSDVGDFQIRRTKVIAPLRDAVRLVDR